MAQRGDEMPTDMPEPDKILYMELRCLYGSVRNKIITRETAITEKKQLLEDYRCYQFQEQMREEWVAAIRNTELARAEFRKNPTVENGWKLLNAVEGN
jgi:hypothetical protein